MLYYYTHNSSFWGFLLNHFLPIIYPRSKLGASLNKMKGDCAASLDLNQKRQGGKRSSRGEAIPALMSIQAQVYPLGSDGLGWLKRAPFSSKQDSTCREETEHTLPCSVTTIGSVSCPQYVAVEFQYT